MLVDMRGSIYTNSTWTIHTNDAYVITVLFFPFAKAFDPLDFSLQRSLMSQFAMHKHQ